MTLDRYRLYGPRGSVIVHAASPAEAEAMREAAFAEQERRAQAAHDEREEAERRAIFGSYDADGRPVEPA